MSTTKVVILNWNGEKFLEKFLGSVVESVPEWVEVVVADNCSSDESVAFVSKNFTQVKIVELDENWGYAEGYNKALAQLSADYFILLNSDVECPKGWVEPLIEALDSDAQLAAVSPKILCYDNKKMFEYAGASGGFIDSLGYPFCRGRILSTLESDFGQYDDRCQIFWASGACVAVRSSVFNEVGGFDGDFFAHMEEIDLCWRMQLFGYKVEVEPKSEVYHVGGGTLPSNSPRKLYFNYRNNLAMLHKNLPKGNRWKIPFRLLLDTFSALVYLVTGKLSYTKAVFRAHCDYRKWKPQLNEQRMEIQNKTVRQPSTIYKGWIVCKYIFGKRKYSQLKNNSQSH